MDARDAGSAPRTPKAKQLSTTATSMTTAGGAESMPPWSARSSQQGLCPPQTPNQLEIQFRSTDQSFNSSVRSKNKFRDHRVNQSVDTARDLRRAVEMAFQTRPKAGPAEWAGTGVAQKLKNRVEASQNLVNQLKERIEACEGGIRKMHRQLLVLSRDREMLEPQQSVVEQRLEIRSRRPESENIQDAFQDVLEHEKRVTDEASKRLGDCILGGQELVQSLEAAKSAMIEDLQFKRYALRLEKSALQFDPYHGRDRACVLPLVTMGASKPASEPVMHGYQDTMDFKFGATFRVYTEVSCQPETEEEGEGNLMRSATATQELMSRTMALEDNVARFRYHTQELMQQLKNEVSEARVASTAGMQESIKELYKQKKCLERLSAERHADIVKTRQLLQNTEQEKQNQQDSIGQWESMPDVTLDRFDQRLPMSLLEDMRNMAVGRLNEQAQFSRSNVHILQGRCEKTEDLLAQLETTLEGLKETLEAKTIAWNLDVNCSKIVLNANNTMKTSELIKATQNPKDAKLALVRCRPLGQDAVDKLRHKLKSAAYAGAEGTRFDEVFSRFDKDASGVLDVEEVRLAIRRSLKIPRETMSDEEIVSLCALLDTDNSGMISIPELTEFACAEKGTKALHDRIFNLEKTGGASFQLDCFANARPGQKFTSASMLADISRSTSNLKKPLSADVLEKVKARIKAAAYAGHLGTDVKSLLSRFDADGSGLLEPEEVRMALRSALRIPPSIISDEDVFKLCRMIDRDNSGHLSIAEIVEFLGPDSMVSKRTGKPSVLAIQMQKLSQQRDLVTTDL